MNRILETALVFFVAAATSCSPVFVYERGPAKRVEVEKVARAQNVVMKAERVRSDAIHIFVGERQEIELTRRIVYGTTEVRREYGNPLWEIVEMPFGALSMFVIPFLLLSSDYRPPPDTDEVRYDRGRFYLTMIFGFINPAESVFGARIVKDPTSDKELFVSPPRTLRYTMTRPLEAKSVHYVIQDVSGTAVWEGSGQTDWLGRLEVVGLTNGWLDLELATEGEAVTIRLPPGSKSPIPESGPDEPATADEADEEAEEPSEGEGEP
jgi:hypothetical protein